ncbi:hypothetical protein RIVM261_075570 [Rivularia sp. IAM M-261]|nr:hypothetical protein RIVM261_075570 [Rivularia sp. IAM M-261]
MSETPKNQNAFTFNAPVGTANAGDTTVQGDAIGIQNNYTREKSLADAAKEIQDLLAQLQSTNSTITEAQKQAAVVKRVEQHIKQNPTIRNRLWSAFKAGGIEALKQTLDAIYENPVVSISVETVKGFLEAEYKE